MQGSADASETPAAAGPDTAPFAVDGSPEGGGIGVVVVHGFTGTPASVRSWADHLAAAGYSVRLPLLPGHGGTWQETNKTTWVDWYGTVETAYRELAEKCRWVFAVGLSMGGTLATRLAEVHPDGVAGLVLVNPAYGTARFDARLAPYISWAVKSRPAIAGDIKKPGVVEPGTDRLPVVAFASLQRLWRVTVAGLGDVRAPILLYRSREDHVVDPLSVRLLRAGATGTTIREVELLDSYHVATMDNDAPAIFAGSTDFIAGIASDDGATLPADGALP